MGPAARTGSPPGLTAAEARRRLVAFGSRTAQWGLDLAELTGRVIWRNPPRRT